MNENNADSKFFNLVKKIVYKILTKEKLLQGDWHLGKVASVVSRFKLNIYIDGSNTIQIVPCNPDVTFAVNDEVFVHFVNGDSKNPFVPYKRATGTES